MSQSDDSKPKAKNADKAEPSTGNSEAELDRQIRADLNAASDANESKEHKTDKKSTKAKIRSRKPEETQVEPWLSEEAITGFFDRISGVTSSAFKFARKTTDTSYKVGKALVQSQDQLKLMVSAGQSLKDLREVAGLTISELNDALQVKDKSLLEAVENGTATLSFELILRLSALLARNDPIPFILKYSRTYSPETWKLLNDWGAGRLPLQYQREREFINIFRSRDEARQLTDEGYSKVLEFTREAFNMSLHFVAEQEAAVEEFRNTHKKKVSDSDTGQPPESKS